MRQFTRIPLDSESNEQPARCCLDEERIEDVETRQGDRVVDLHKHKGLLKGLVMLESGKKVLHWYRNGRLSRAKEQQIDLRRIG